MISPLADLDELILKCRDDKAKAYIAEAVASYRGGAFRSSIVATWIAVCFDVIDKIRELALAGDKEAEKQAEEIEKTRKLGDIANALRFEREILELARDKFELISHVEFVDLDRLQQDRNRCAHPSLVTEGEAFTPSAELARVHIRSAVTHLLQHPPVQGKFALERLIAEIDSEYFSDNKDKAIVALSSGPLKKPRESLVRNFTIILIKRLLKENVNLKQRLRVAAALNAVASLHSAWYDATMKEKLSSIVRALQDDELEKVIFFFQNVSDVWQFLEEDVRQRCENFVSALPSALLVDLDFLLTFKPLASFAEHRLTIATLAEIKNTMFFELPAEVAEKTVKSYLEASTFDEANEWAKQLAIHASNLTAEQITRIITNAAKNDQVLYSFELGALLYSLRSRKKLSVDAFDALLHQNGLGKYAPAPAQQA